MRRETPLPERRAELRDPVEHLEGQTAAGSLAQPAKTGLPDRHLGEHERAVPASRRSGGRKWGGVDGTGVHGRRSWQTVRWC